jgi:hypothetical protein
MIEEALLDKNVFIVKGLSVITANSYKYGNSIHRPNFASDLLAISFLPQALCL